jgi:D-beta-D-heptose 7-phosphate kinase/D-beta-D-heptose 1-phosphate adenosyltransferase
MARNIASIGAKCLFVATIGRDDAAHLIVTKLHNEPRIEPHLVVDPTRPTTRKARFVSEHFSTHLLRADWEFAKPVAADVEQELIDKALEALPRAAIVVLSDYAKGVLTPRVIGEVIAAARHAGKPVIVDPKNPDLSAYRGAAVITPNRKELADVVGSWGTERDLERRTRKLRAQLGLEALLLTRGQDGMTLFSKKKPVHVKAEAREVFDVSGAGDTVIATLATMLASGLRLEQAVRIANRAGGIKVAKLGTAVVTRRELFST